MINEINDNLYSLNANLHFLCFFLRNYIFRVSFQILCTRIPDLGSLNVAVFASAVDAGNQKIFSC